MNSQAQSGPGKKRKLCKSPTGVQGLDEITGGGLPAGRPTLLCGGPGSGKTLLAMEFIIKGITAFSQNGVYLTFEESKDELYDNVASLGFCMDDLERDQHIFVTEIDLELHDMVETGEYNLEGLFSKIGHAVDQVNAERVVIDGIETLFSHFSKKNIIRKEVKRLHHWLKEKGVTAIITSERGADCSSITRHGIEEYISDCVIMLDHRIEDQIATRRLQIIKYRGSWHGTNEYPFLITDNGISVFPITSITMNHPSTTEHVATGIQQLDTMLGGEGYYKGSSILISGTAGTGKSSIAAFFAKATCSEGEKCLYFAFEESSNQIIRNMNAIGLDLQTFINRGLLKIHAARPVLQGLEMHLLTIHKIIEQVRPSAVILDPVTNLDSIGKMLDIKLLFIRIIDFLKKNGITALFTALTAGESSPEATEVGISSIMDTWILLQHLEKNGRRERSMYIMKSRGIAHSNSIHRFAITDTGIDING